MLKLDEILQGVKRAGIAGHVRPDGDCTGSCLALYQYLRMYYPEVRTDVYLEEIPNSFHMLTGADEIRHELPEDTGYDVFFALDCGDTKRLGFAGTLFEQAKKTVCIDHHVSNLAFADVNQIVPDASSTSELIYDLLEKERITKEIAEALYLGIVHDTGVFQYSCTKPSTMEAAAELLRKGIDGPKIIEKTFYEKTYAQNQVLGKALLESIRLMDGKVIFSYITKKSMNFFGVKAKDLEGIVSQLRVTTGVEAAIFLYELESGEFKVSLRSKEKVDVSKVAQYFGGGGHVRAAGLTFRGTVHDAVNNIVGQVALQLEEEA
ncbi:bifunctional oligoribonuclease/PAP phosphatase NrnA [Drancourtella massiliensis]|uniref:Bifunctional oligoribonuclease/PAP phosphatase NrnA n=1 Tax=Drancourtella massiliensis TaxID=1632013 RepID=A0ABS2ED14_9FIRM|nr:bifunctional oligoribonuclease/PAP phosphatase NrnA [Drancourtella massiliensis]MBM6742807.1 bifunctional oligoribonuclease/PAP phosphatase NrnA [Drancourtella massiliensis]